MKTGKLLLLVLLQAIVFSCSKREDVVPGRAEPAVLTSVTVSTNAVVLSEGESASVSFTVNNPEYEFNYVVSSLGCQVKILLSGGMDPEEFRLAEVTPGAKRGIYTAVIADISNGKGYDREAVIAVATSPGVYVRSQSFRVMSEVSPAGTVKTGLPIVYVNTENAAPIKSKDTFVNTTVTIKGDGGYPGLDASPARIRGRGNTTWTWPKKPYLIAFDKRQSVLGMPEHKRWVLLANFMDRTLMRNMVAMKVSSMMDNLDWTPRSVPVELVLNGKHQGTYLLIEQVRVDENRVNISEEGGYIFELDFHYDNAVQWMDKHGSCHGRSGGIPFSVKYPDDDEITPEQITYAKNYIAEVASVIYGNYFTDSVSGYAKYLDVDSFIDYWLVYELMTNHELGNPGSVMFHKDAGGKLTAGPCWDFDWGVLSFYTSNGASGLVVKDAIWYSRLFQDPAFKAKVKARFLELKPQLQTIPAYMDECEKLLEKSAELNFKMWNPADDKSQNGGSIINGDENMTFHDAVVRLKSNYNKHLQIIEKKL